MSYSIVEIEVTQDVPALSSSKEETGVAVLLRRKGRPIAFWMDVLPPGSMLSSDEVARRIEERAGKKVLTECLREELTLPPAPVQLPSVTVAICTKDRPEQLARCLASLKDVQLPGSIPGWEVLVVDNASSNQATQDVVASIPEVRYVWEPKPGLDFARNSAVRAAAGELVAFVDDDVVVDHGWLAGLMESFSENPDAAAFTGLVLPYELETPAQVMFEAHGGFRRGFDKIRYHGQRLPGNPLYPCGAGIFGAGANMAFRRDALVELGGFDEALDTGAPLPGGGDLDMFYRIIRAGYPLVYEPTYLVFHRHRRTIDGLRRQYLSWGQGFMAFVTKSYRDDPDQRSRFLRLVWWWFKHELKQLLKSMQGRHPLPPRMITAELWGGIVGLLGEYDRSSSRIASIRKQFSGEAPSAPWVAQHAEELS